MRFLAMFFSAIALAACGGGGSGTPTPAGPIASTLSFPYGAAVKTENSTGSSVTLTAIGTASTESTDGLCSGTRTFFNGAPTGGTVFEGITAFSVAGTTTTNWTNCTPSSSVSSGTSYYDSNYAFLGSISQTGSYMVRPIGFVTPSYVRVGDVVIRGTDYIYTDSSKTVDDGHRDVSIIVEPDTADTAIINSISKYYNPYIAGRFTKDGKLTLLSQYRSRITASGTTTLVSVDLQYYDTATTTKRHYVFRR